VVFGGVFGKNGGIFPSFYQGEGKNFLNNFFHGLMGVTC
jgi:hypothetical protein